MSSTESANVIDLLTYIEEVEKLKRKPTYVLPTEFYVGHQVALKGLPDLQANLQNNESEIWLSVPRLQEIAAPDTPAELTPWVSIEYSHEYRHQFALEYRH